MLGGWWRAEPKLDAFISSIRKNQFTPSWGSAFPAGRRSSESVSVAALLGA
jgi:hypothetical protein